MASYPTFDNRWFNSGVDSAKFDELFPGRSRAARTSTPTSPASPTGPSRASTTWARRSRSFVAYAGAGHGAAQRRTRSTTTRARTRCARSTPTLCAQGVRCVYRNSTCPHNGEPCKYGAVDVATSLAVSSDAFYYKLGEDFYLTPGTPLQDHVRQFGFGADTGIDLPFEFDGRIPTNELKAQLVADGVLDPRARSPRCTPGDLLQMAIGQGLMAASPLQLAVGYSAIANGGAVLVPQVVQAISSPRCPTASPASPTSSQATRRARRTTPEGRQIPMPAAVRDPIVGGHPAQRHRARRQRPVDDGRGAVRGRTTRRRRSRSPARPAPRRARATTRGTTRRRSPPSASIRRSRTRSCRTSRRPASARPVRHPS